MFTWWEYVFYPGMWLHICCCWNSSHFCYLSSFHMFFWFSFPNLVSSKTISKSQDYERKNPPKTYSQTWQIYNSKLLRVHQPRPWLVTRGELSAVHVLKRVGFLHVLFYQDLKHVLAYMSGFKKQMVRSSSSWRCCSSLGNTLLSEVNQTEVLEIWEWRNVGISSGQWCKSS